jgi:hypothetical protein
MDLGVISIQMEIVRTDPFTHKGKMKTYEKKLDEIADLVIKLSWTKNTLQGLFIPNASYTGTRLNHREFFHVGHDGLISYFCTSTAILFWQKDQYESLVNLIDELETSRGNSALAKILRDKIAVEATTIKKFCDMRHQHFAHRVISKTSKDVWTEINITLNGMQKVVDVAEFCIQELVREAGNPEGLTEPFDNATKARIADDTKKILECLSFNDAHSPLGG